MKLVSEGQCFRQGLTPGAQTYSRDPCTVNDPGGDTGKSRGSSRVEGGIFGLVLLKPQYIIMFDGI